MSQYPNAQSSRRWSSRARFLLPGTLGTLLEVAGRVEFAVWAVMELGWGANPFRRIVGVVVVLGTLVSLFGRRG